MKKENTTFSKNHSTELSDIIAVEELEKCDCKEMSCVKDCKRNHTHKRFFCNICEPNAVKAMEPESSWEDDLTKAIDILTNAISDDNHALEICIKEEIWKIVYRIEQEAYERGRNEGLENIKKEIDIMIPIAIIAHGTPVEEGLVSKLKIIETLKTLKK